jgi:hypothetical protein
VRPEHEQKIDEAAVAVQLFERLRSAAQRALFDAQQGQEEYVPRMPSEERVQLAAGQIMADPGLQVRLALLAGAFFEPVPPAALLPVAQPPSVALAPESEAPSEDEEPEEAAVTTMAPGDSQEGQDAPQPAEPGKGQAELQAKIGKLIGAIKGRTWGQAEAQVKHFPKAIKEHWTTVLRKARTANEVLSTITHDNLDSAALIAAEIDCLPVREGLDERIAYLRNGLPPRLAPEPPARRERRPPPIPALAQERAELPPPLAPSVAPEPAPSAASVAPPPRKRKAGGA